MGLNEYSSYGLENSKKSRHSREYGNLLRPSKIN